MKTLCCVGISLLLAGYAVSGDDGKDVSHFWERCETYPEEVVAHMREGYKNPGTLKESLAGHFTSEHFLEDGEIPLYKQKFHIEDGALRGALMDIYKSVQYAGRETFRNDTPEEIALDMRRLCQSIRWMGYCADGSVKGLLMGIAADDAKERVYRVAAMVAYIQCADAQETRGALARFLIDMKGFYAPHASIFRVYDEPECDPQKREAIIASLIVALAREEGKTRFAEMDKELAERSREYATSAQRLAMVKRMSKLPPSSFRDTDPDLKRALASFRFRLFKTNVSTNLTELMSRDFTTPLGKPKP